MKLLFLSISILFFSNCSNDVSLKAVRFDRLFNDNSSKVWLIEDFILDDVNISPFEIAQKEIMIFHKNSHVDIIALNGVGNILAKKGDYFLNSEDRTMQISFSDQEWNMHIEYITEDSILLRTTNLDPNLELKIIPFPEL